MARTLCALSQAERHNVHALSGIKECEADGIPNQPWPRRTRDGWLGWDG